MALILILVKDPNNMSTIPGFSINVIPKNKDEITNYKNFMSSSVFKFKTCEGKIVYTNFLYPGKHIYTPYYVYGDTASPLLYMDDKNNREKPMFSIQDLNYDDVIVFYTPEEA